MLKAIMLILMAFFAVGFAQDAPEPQELTLAKVELNKPAFGAVVIMDHGAMAGGVVANSDNVSIGLNRKQAETQAIDRSSIDKTGLLLNNRSSVVANLWGREKGRSCSCIKV